MISSKCTIGPSGVILNLNWVHGIFSLPSFVYLIKWYIIITYVSTKYVFVSYLVMFVCWHRKNIFHKSNCWSSQKVISYCLHDESYNFLFCERYLILKPDSAVELGARTFTTVFTTSCWFIAEVPECPKSWWGQAYIWWA